MIENVVTCDRCKKKCEGTTYYTLNINAHDINPTNDGRVSFETLANNTYVFAMTAFGSKKHYCENCIKSLGEYMAEPKTESWIDINERLPEENIRVLVALSRKRGDYTSIDTDRMEKGKWIRWGRRVTHWMSLPELPKGER